jgi:hypothetical protein
VIYRDGVCAVRLYFYRIGASLFGGLNDAQSTVDVTVVITRHLGNDVRRFAWTDATPGDADKRLPIALRQLSPCCVLPFHKATPEVLIIKKVFRI